MVKKTDIVQINMKILTVLCPVHQSIHLMRTDHILLATRVKILRADRAAAKVII